MYILQLNVIVMSNITYMSLILSIQAPTLRMFFRACIYMAFRPMSWYSVFLVPTMLLRMAGTHALLLDEAIV